MDHLITGSKCRVCGCTDDDCRQCVEKTGMPCYWVEEGLCSACAGTPYPVAVSAIFTFGDDPREQTMKFDTEVMAGHEQEQLQDKTKALMKGIDWADAKILNITFEKILVEDTEYTNTDGMFNDGDDYAEYTEIE